MEQCGESHEEERQQIVAQNAPQEMRDTGREGAA